MPDFLDHRASHLLDEARALAAAGEPLEASRRMEAAADLLERAHGRAHRELPEILQLLADLCFGQGDLARAEAFQTRAWELRHLRSRRSRRFLAVSRLDPTPPGPADGWPLAGRALLEQVRSDGFAEKAPEVFVFGPPESGKTRFLHALGHAAIERPTPVRLYQGYELFETLRTARRVLGFRRQLDRLDRFALLLVDELDPWSLTRGEAELFHTMLIHRRHRLSTVLATRTEQPLEPRAFLAQVRRTKALRYPSPTAVVIALGRHGGRGD